jgi:hypothetical protein
MTNKTTDRRNFLRTATIGLAVPAALAACSKDDKAKPALVAVASAAPNGGDDMDAMHEAGVKAFPAKTEGRGVDLQ